MEMNRISSNIEDAKRWLRSAYLNKEGKNYDKALYDLEMSMEVALKAVLIALKEDFPKSHYIGELFRDIYSKNKERFPKTFKDNFDAVMDTFDLLLRYRNASGYSGESSMTQKDFEEKVKKNFEMVTRYVDICSKTAEELSKHQ